MISFRLLPLFLLIPVALWSQHSLQVYYGPAISKLTVLAEEYTVNEYIYVKEEKDGDQPFRSRTWGIAYGYERHRNMFTVTAKDIIHGQQPVYYDKNMDNLSGRFGSFYRMVYWGTSVSAGYGYALAQNTNVRLRVKGGVGAAVTRRIGLHNGHLPRSTGSFGGGAFTTGVRVVGDPGNYFYQIQRGIRHRYLWMEYNLGMDLRCRLSERIWFSLTPTAYFYHKIVAEAERYGFYFTPYFAGDVSVGLVVYLKKMKKNGENK